MAEPKCKSIFGYQILAENTNKFLSVPCVGLERIILVVRRIYSPNMFFVQAGLIDLIYRNKFTTNISITYGKKNICIGGNMLTQKQIYCL